MKFMIKITDEIFVQGSPLAFSNINKGISNESTPKKITIIVSKVIFSFDLTNHYSYSTCLKCVLG